MNILSRIKPTFILISCFASLAAAGAGTNSRPFLELTREAAEDLSQLSLECIHKPFPNKPGHVLLSEEDVETPMEYRPAFYGCFDWHSAVHGHWTLVQLLKDFPEMENAEVIREKLSMSLTVEKLRVELEYFQTPGRESFQRMYGWAWFLRLAKTLYEWDDPDARVWYAAVKPLAEHLVQLTTEFLPKQTYPIRRGVHPNTAFALSFAWDYAVAVGDTVFQQAIREAAMRYFAADQNYPAHYEQGGDNFFSPSLTEANLMHRILDPITYSDWLNDFLPGILKREPANLFEPAYVSDRTDGFIVHLDGLNLSRAWCMAEIAAALPKGDERKSVLIESASIHLTSALPEIATGNYEGEHWLASFAVYALKSL